MKYSKVNGYDHLLRDESTKSIINTNVSDYENYMKMKNVKQKESQKIQKIEEDLSSLKNDINEIKNLLRNLANG
jgi:conjugal transfer/entry exclusion protein